MVYIWIIFVTCIKHRDIEYYVSFSLYDRHLSSVIGIGKLEPWIMIQILTFYRSAAVCKIYEKAFSDFVNFARKSFAISFISFWIT